MTEKAMTEKDFPMPTHGGRFARDLKSGALTELPPWTPEEEADFRKAESTREAELKPAAKSKKE